MGGFIRLIEIGLPCLTIIALGLMYTIRKIYE